MITESNNEGISPEEEAFRYLCKEVFETVKGRELLAFLKNNIADPLEHTVTDDARRDAFKTGERSVISLLYRCSEIK